MRLPITLLLCLLPLSASAAINPAEYTRHAPLALQLQVDAQIVQHFEIDGDAHRRTTIVATVVGEHRDTALVPGDTVTIDWTVDLDAQAAAAEEHAEAMAGRSGPQFLHAPPPPTADDDGLIWAHLAIDPTAGPAIAAPEAGSDRRVGAILVPAAHQYSFDPPSD